MRDTVDKRIDETGSGDYCQRSEREYRRLALDPEAGARLKAYMEPRIGKVQPWSERHGIGRDTIYALWRGREPQPDTLARIAEAMGVSYQRLLRERAGISVVDAQPDDLVAALRDQTTAISALAASLDRFAVGLAAEAEAQAGMNEGLAVLAGQVVAALQAREGKPG